LKDSLYFNNTIKKVVFLQEIINQLT